MNAERVIVVGAGLAGLAVAAELAREHPVTVVERLPAPGGVWGFDQPRVRELVSLCTYMGVEFLLGMSALRWTGERLLVVGPGRIEWLEGSQLFFAGGTRPSTAAELGIAGGRLAGVFAATVAHHLLDAGVVLGRRTVVVGTGDGAELVIPHLLRDGTVTVVGGEPRTRPLPQRLLSWPGYRPVRMTGSGRVDKIVVTDGRQNWTYIVTAWCSRRHRSPFATSTARCTMRQASHSSNRWNPA